MGTETFLPEHEMAGKDFCRTEKIVVSIIPTGKVVMDSLDGREGRPAGDMFWSRPNIPWGMEIVGSTEVLAVLLRDVPAHLQGP